MQRRKRGRSEERGLKRERNSPTITRKLCGGNGPSAIPSWKGSFKGKISGDYRVRDVRKRRGDTVLKT